TSWSRGCPSSSPAHAGVTSHDTSARGQRRLTRFRIGSVCTTSPIALGLMISTRFGSRFSGGDLLIGSPLLHASFFRLLLKPRERRITLAERQAVRRRVLPVLAHALEQPLHPERPPPVEANAVDVDQHRRRPALLVRRDDPVAQLGVEVREAHVVNPPQD